MSTFDSTKTPLPEIIKQITEGKLVDRGVSNERVEEPDNDEIQLMAVNA
jgi:hypothetical protein